MKDYRVCCSQINYYQYFQADISSCRSRKSVGKAYYIKPAFDFVATRGQQKQVEHSNDTSSPQAFIILTNLETQLQKMNAIVSVMNVCPSLELFLMQKMLHSLKYGDFLFFSFI